MSHEVIYGLFGCFFGLFIGLSTHYFYLKTLVIKSEKDGRTAENILGGFYYIIPEDEFIELTLFSRGVDKPPPGVGGERRKGEGDGK